MNRSEEDTAPPLQKTPLSSGGLSGLRALPLLLHRRDLLLRAALESLLIVLSVFLALFLDEWRAEREQSARVETARAYLERELRANRDRLRSNLAYHLRMNRLLEPVLDEQTNQDDALLDFQREFKGVRPFKAQNVAWSSFVRPEISQRLPPEELFLLAQLYDHQDSLNQISAAFISGFLQPSAEMGSEAYRLSQLQVIQFYFGDAIPNERELLGRYDAVLRQLERNEKP